MRTLRDPRFWGGVLAGAVLVMFFPQLNVLRGYKKGPA